MRQTPSSIGFRHTGRAVRQFAAVATPPPDDTGRLVEHIGESSTRTVEIFVEAVDYADDPVGVTTVTLLTAKQVAEDSTFRRR